MTQSGLPPLRDVIRHHGLDARKSLGQHFLLDGNLTDRIVRIAGEMEGRNIIEIGPGPGGLTRSLLASSARKVVAVERDKRCIEALTELAQAFPERLEIIEADALKVDLCDACPPPRRIVANLPYNVGTPLLIGWLRQINEYESLTLMFQKEVADRLSARPGNKSYGRLSVLTQWLCDVRHDFNVSRNAFTPPPKIASSIVTLTPRSEPLAPANWEKLEKVTAAAFGQRRKMLRSSLKSLDVDLESLGIDPTARAETLDVTDFCAIANKI